MTGHGSITVDQDGENTEAANGAAVLLGANDALKHAVDSLEVRGVGCQINRNLATGGARVHTLGAKVVLHIAGAVDVSDILGSFKLAENLPVRLAGDVGEHVEPSAVGHGDSDLVETVVIRGSLHDFVNQADC